MARLVLIRHGETEWSASGKHTSVTDVPLLDVGRRHAERLRDRLAGREFALVLCSPRSRARETAAPGGDGSSRSTRTWSSSTTARTRGGRRRRSASERPGWSVWSDGAPGGETVEQVGVRADRVISRALAAEGDVALFAHGHLLRVLAARWIGLPAAYGGHLALDTGSVSELGFERERRVVWLWNDTSHLNVNTAG